MNEEQKQLEFEGRRAVQALDWETVQSCAAKILRADKQSAEGHFLAALVAKAAGVPNNAINLFEKVLEIDPARYDAAIELASLYTLVHRNADAARLLGENVLFLRKSPRYLDMAGTVYSNIGLFAEAWPLYLRANELQPATDVFQANLASCAVSLGRTEEAKTIYHALLERFPAHQRNHYRLSRLATAQDTKHIRQMLSLARSSNLQPEQLIYLFYAIGKEYEDLELWDNAFSFYEQAGNTIGQLADYDLATDVALIDTAIEVCDAEWLATAPASAPTTTTGKTPIFTVGLPGAGITLTANILSSHSKVLSLGETRFMQVVLRRNSGINAIDAMNPDMIRAMAKLNIDIVANGYLDAVGYRLGEEPMFIDRWPINVLHLGFIAKAFPDAKIVHLQRHPMDTCLAMYKRLFTRPYKFSYTLDGLAGYYIAYHRLLQHWRNVLGERLIEVRYEDLVSDQKTVTLDLLTRLGLDFEQTCLDFERDPAAPATASSMQARQKLHTRSIDKWRHFKKHLLPLQQRLQSAGILPD